MAETISLRMPKKEWRAFEAAIDPKKYGPRLKKHIKRATARNALILQKGVRKEIRTGVPPTNAALTKALKGGDKPLVGTAGSDLFNSITHEVTSWDRAIVGVIRRNEDGIDIAQVVHDGVTIGVSQKMRNLFYALAAASRLGDASHLEGRALELWVMGGGTKTEWHPLKPTTLAIVIPPRPYLRYATQEPSTKRAIKANWDKAVEDSLKESAKVKG